IKMAPAKCPHCGSSDIVLDPARGDTVCTSCGVVLAEDNIVSEVQFLENAGGGSSAIGQFVSSDSTRSRPMFKGFNGNFVRESREITLNKARQKINALAQQLRLSSHHIDTSHNFFKLSLSKGLTRGRKSNHVIGACVYITCRTEATPHMLIDVSDAIQCDVYELGRTYLRLSTALCINIPAMDPCLYIWRFAHKLQFNDDTYKVSETALRLVKRMKRDWMHVGRRPSGVCGAALVIAARLHNFNRTISDVIKVVKVHESTLRKRLTEFGETPSSALSPEEFMSMDLDEEQDPPSFTKARNKEKVEQEKLPTDQKALDAEFQKLQAEIDKHLEERKQKLRGIWAKYDNEDRESKQKSETDQETEETQKFITEATLESIDECLSNDNNVSGNVKIEEKPQGLGPTAESLGLKESIEECMEVRPSKPEPEDNGVLDLEGIDEDEIDSYIMSEREAKFKHDMWMKINKVYLEELKIKQENEEREEEERKKSGKPPKKKKTYTKKNKNNGPANTAGEAIEKMLMEKKLSSKINYDVLKNLNGDCPEEDTEDIKEEKPNPKHLKIEKIPVETPEVISSILQSLTGKRPWNPPKEEFDNQNKKMTLDDDVPKIKEQMEEEEEEEEEEPEDEDEDDSWSTTQLLRQRRGVQDNYDDYDDYYD
ncbi:unnamed protein product, partial [Meganyctiphanes norvegica]